MSDTTPDQAEVRQPVPALDNPDIFLRHLVYGVNETGNEIPITLHVSGLIVTGILVSGRNYFSGAGNSFLEMFSSAPDFAEALKNEFTEAGNIIYGPKNPGSPPQPLPAYIHMRDARYFLPGGSAASIPSGEGTWWRGRLSEVSAFFIGSLTNGSSPKQQDSE